MLVLFIGGLVFGGLVGNRLGAWLFARRNPRRVPPIIPFPDEARVRETSPCDSPGTGLKGSFNGNSKLSESVVVEARAMRSVGARVDELAALYGVAQSVMSRALSGKTWSHV